MQQAAILTGDLIGSTTAEAAATETALRCVEQAARAIGAWTDWRPADQRHHVTRFRGDGWQFAVPLRHGPRAALTVIAALTAARGLHSRLALGLGRVDDWGPSGDLSAARGPALTASGRALDAMKPGQLLTLASLPADLDLDPRDTGLMTLWAALARHWTPEQAEALALMLRPTPPRQTAIAASLGISPQAVSQRLRGAEAEALIQSLTLWEAAADRLPRTHPDQRPPR